MPEKMKQPTVAEAKRRADVMARIDQRISELIEIREALADRDQEIKRLRTQITKAVHFIENIHSLAEGGQRRLADAKVFDDICADATSAAGLLTAHASAESDTIAIELRECAAFMYQYAGATDAPVEVLDNLSDLANGEPKRHADWPYPAGSDKFDALVAENARLRTKPDPDPLASEVQRREGR